MAASELPGSSPVLPQGEIHLLRHAVALDRRKWHADDVLRPLAPRGAAQAEAIALRYRARHPGAFVSSPALRCLQTLQPTAEAWSARIEPVEFLEEGATPLEARRGLLFRLGGLDERGGLRLLAACTHGDVMQGLVQLLLEDGVAIDHPSRTPKGATFELGVDSGAITAARFVPPPDVGT